MTSEQSSTTPETCLTATNLTRRFGPVAVIDDVDMSVHRGTLHGLVGPNGSGKTTLLQLLAGLLDPTDGTVTYDVADHPRTVGYLPQQPAFRPSFSALETLEFYAALVGADAETLLARVGLSDAADRRVSELSGGMTRLLGLAQALAGDPPVVLLDEPGSGLDPGMRARTISVAQSLAADGTAVLYTTHDLELAEQHCDRVTMLDTGSVVATGPPETLLEDSEETLRGAFERVADTDAVTVTGATES